MLLFRKGTSSTSKRRRVCKSSAGVIHWCWNLCWTKQDWPWEQNPPRQHRKLPILIFWLAKLPAPALQTWGESFIYSWHCALYLLSCQHFISFPSSIHAFLSFLCPHSLPPPIPAAAELLWFPNWSLGSALCCHMTRILRSRVVKHKALDSMCMHTPWTETSQGHCVVTHLNRATLTELTLV